jgi:hypothetical protein
MAEVIAAHCPIYRYSAINLRQYWRCSDLDCGDTELTFTEACEHVAAELAKAGYGKLADAWDEGYKASEDSVPSCEDPCGACAECAAPEPVNPYRGAGHE